MEKIEATKSYRLYHYALTIPNSALALSSIPVLMDTTYQLICNINYRAAEKIKPIVVAVKRGNAYDDTDSSFISFTINYSKNKLAAVVDEVLTMLEYYNYTTTDFDANYTSRNVILAIAALKTLTYVIKHSKYSTSYTTKKIDYSSSYRWPGYPEVNKSVYDPEDFETRPADED